MHEAAKRPGGQPAAGRTNRGALAGARPGHGPARSRRRLRRCLLALRLAERVGLSGANRRRSTTSPCSASSAAPPMPTTRPPLSAATNSPSAPRSPLPSAARTRTAGAGAHAPRRRDGGAPGAQVVGAFLRHRTQSGTACVRTASLAEHLGATRLGLQRGRAARARARPGALGWPRPAQPLRR